MTFGPAHGWERGMRARLIITGVVVVSLFGYLPTDIGFQLATVAGTYTACTVGLIVLLRDNAKRAHSIHIVLDVIATTAVVWLTGGSGSPYLGLFLLLSLGGGWLTTGANGLLHILFVMFGLLAATVLLPIIPGGLQASRLAPVIMFYLPLMALTWAMSSRTIQTVSATIRHLVTRLDLFSFETGLVEELSEAREPDHSLQVFVDKTRKHLGTSLAAIALSDRREDDLVLVVVSGGPPIQTAKGSRIPLDDLHSPVVCAVRERRFVIEKDASPRSKIAERLGVSTLLAIPMVFTGNVYGVLILGDDTHADFIDDEQARQISSLVGRVTEILCRMTQLKRTQDRAALDAAIGEAAVGAAAADSLTEALARVADVCRCTLKASHVAIVIEGHNGQDRTEIVCESTDPTSGRSDVGEVWLGRLAVPILADGVRIGMLDIARERGLESFTEDEAAALSMFAALASAVLGSQCRTRRLFDLGSEIAFAYELKRSLDGATTMESICIAAAIALAELVDDAPAAAAIIRDGIVHELKMTHSLGAFDGAAGDDRIRAEFEGTAVDVPVERRLVIRDDEVSRMQFGILVDIEDEMLEERIGTIEYVAEECIVAARRVHERDVVMNHNASLIAALDAFREGVMIVAVDYSLLHLNNAARRSLGVHVGGSEEGKCYEICKGGEVPCPDCPARHAIVAGRTITRREEVDGGICCEADPIGPSERPLGAVVRVQSEGHVRTRQAS